MAQWVAGAVLALWLIVLSVTDLRQRRLPNTLTLPGALVILLGAVTCGRGAAALTGAAALAGLYLMLHLLSPGGMGAGDVKLALGLGGVTGALGAQVWVLAALGAPLLTVAWALAARARVLPHGPSMCLATALAVVTCR
ncbi:prepilin peptidase [Mycolicibacterium mengxianglii]|uniref:prepilin peptidase n=1 Tax=Mycolicibacterium mengxianglii TaxID=2736649 RepID=UPI0018D1AF57|nr:A24 family peptidase [Mycolicibacterium mengxianglii]